MQRNNTECDLTSCCLHPGERGGSPGPDCTASSRSLWTPADLQAAADRRLRPTAHVAAGILPFTAGQRERAGDTARCGTG